MSFLPYMAVWFKLSIVLEFNNWKLLAARLIPANHVFKTTYLGKYTKHDSQRFDLSDKKRATSNLTIGNGSFGQLRYVCR